MAMHPQRAQQPSKSAVAVPAQASGSEQPSRRCASARVRPRPLEWARCQGRGHARAVRPSNPEMVGVLNPCYTHAMWAVQGQAKPGGALRRVLGGEGAWGGLKSQPAAAGRRMGGGGTAYSRQSTLRRANAGARAFTNDKIARVKHTWPMVCARVRWVLLLVCALLVLVQKMLWQAPAAWAPARPP
jgi:hypothetical protein